MTTHNRDPATLPGALRHYQEHHFQNVEDIGVAFDGTRVWVCINGVSLLRAKWMQGKLQVEYNPPEGFSDE